MTYASGGLIQATDYNDFINGANQLNTVWSTGSGVVGFGQTALSNVSVSSTVTATQWATLINTLNSVRTHQTGSGSGVSAPTAGSTISYLATVASAINSAYTSAQSAAFASQGSTTTGSVFSPNFSVGSTTAAQTWTFTRTITFASANQARYFFNAGGQLNLVTTSAVANDGSGRSSDWATVIGTELNGITAIRANTNGGRTGSGGTVNVANTNLGYYQCTTSAQTMSQITTTNATYSGDYVIVAIRSSGTSGSNGDKGNIVYLDFTVYSAARSYANTVNVTWNHRIDVVYPETTNLTNSWGTVTIT